MANDFDDENSTYESFADKYFAYKSFADKYFADKSFADRSIDDKNYADRSFDDRSFDDKNVEDENFDEEEYAENDLGEKGLGEKNLDDKIYADRNYADKSFNDKNYADKSFAEKSFNDRSYADKSFEDKNYADKSYVDNSFANQNNEKPIGSCSKSIDCCEMIKGNSLDLNIEKDDCEIRTDMMVGREKTVRIWGQIRDCEKRPVPYVLLKLIRVSTNKGGHKEYVGVAHTVTDCEGFYQFDLPQCEKNNRFKILAGKAATGKERVICSKGVCDPCKEDPCEIKC